MNSMRLAAVDPVHARVVIEDYCTHVGVEFRESFTPAQAADFLRRMDYDCTPGTIPEFCRKHYFQPDDPDALLPVDVYCLMGALEGRRRWKSTPCRHDCKKSGFRLQVEQARNQGISPPVEGLDDVTVEDALLELTGTDNRALREGLLEVLKLKLEGFEE